jgi:CheY-like chemotaxis protein
LTTTFEADVIAADTHAHALDALRRGPIDLVLVNRVADADGAEGIELIRAMKDDSKLSGVPVMLVSNLAEAQEEAVAAGARMGFGKSELSGEVATERIGAALGS